MKWKVAQLAGLMLPDCEMTLWLVVPSPGLGWSLSQVLILRLSMPSPRLGQFPAHQKAPSPHLVLLTWSGLTISRVSRVAVEPFPCLLAPAYTFSSFLFLSASLLFETFFPLDFLPFPFDVMTWLSMKLAKLGSVSHTQAQYLGLSLGLITCISSWGPQMKITLCCAIWL